MEILRRNTDYAIRALVHLAANADDVMSAAEIAEKQEIPIDYLQKILRKFVRRGIVDSQRGAQGGFSLAKEPRQVTVREVVETMQGKLAVNKCFFDKDGCSRAPHCPLKQNWLEVQIKIEDFLGGITLDDLVNQVKNQNMHN